MRTLYTFIGYYLTLVLFGLCGLVLSLLALPAGLFPSTERRERFFQRIIHRHFSVFIAWTSFARLFHVRFHGLERLPPGRSGLIVAANHPGLVDITCLLARLPEAICIFKPAIRHNPVLGLAAHRAGYLANDGGHGLVRRAIKKLTAGHTLVIFPEGTRTPPGTKLLPLKPGFILMAQQADVPVQLVHIACTHPVLAKGRAWWKLPPLPATADVTIGPCLHIAADADIARVTAWIADWLRTPESAEPPACTEAAGVVLCTVPSASTS